MARTAKGSGFKMRSGNKTSFKDMGSSPVRKFSLGDDYKTKDIGSATKDAQEQFETEFNQHKSSPANKLSKEMRQDSPLHKGGVKKTLKKFGKTAVKVTRKSLDPAGIFDKTKVGKGLDKLADPSGKLSGGSGGGKRRGGKGGQRPSPRAEGANPGGPEGRPVMAMGGIGGGGRRRPAPNERGGGPGGGGAGRPGGGKGGQRPAGGGGIRTASSRGPATPPSQRRPSGKGGQRPSASGPMQKRAPYKMKRGNKPSFKDLGSSKAKKY